MYMEKNPNYIGIRVREARKKAKLTQSELAEAINLSVRGVQNIEYGETKSPNFSTLKAIAEATAHTIDYFTGESTTMSELAGMKQKKDFLGLDLTNLEPMHPGELRGIAAKALDELDEVRHLNIELQKKVNALEKTIGDLDHGLLHKLQSAPEAIMDTIINSLDKVNVGDSKTQKAES